MSLENRLMDLSHKHPFNSATLVALEHQQIVMDYDAPGELVADYLEYKYATPKPLGFLLWYVDYAAEKKKLVQRMCKPRGCEYPDPHKFP